MTTTTTKHTYLRDLVPAEKCGQCPCCLRGDIRSTRSGNLVRHGWREVGRQVGQYGCGYQFGECHGTARRPLETTDADAQVILANLETEITKTEDARREHETEGADAYHYTFTLKTEYEYNDEARAKLVAGFVKGFTKRDLEFSDRETTERYVGLRVSQHKAHAFRFTVARGADEATVLYREVTAKDDLRHSKDSVAAKVPSYAALRATFVRDLADTVTALRRQRDAIKAAIKHHFENPSNGQKDAKRRAKLVHLAKTWIVPAEQCHPGTTLEQRTRRGLACGKRSNTFGGRLNLAKTEKSDEVTCPKCKAVIEKDAK